MPEAENKISLLSWTIIIAGSLAVVAAMVIVMGGTVR